MATEKTIVINAETSEAKKNVEELNKETSKTGQTAQKSKEDFSGLTGQIDKMTGGAVTGFKSVLKGAKSATTGFKTLRGAIISTGIGALVVAVASLATAFQRNQDEADKLSLLFAKIGAITDVLLDGLADLGSVIIDAFTNPQKAIEDLWKVIKTNLINRVKGVIDTFGAVGKAIKSVINLDWDGLKDASTDFVSAQQQIITGVTAEQWGNLAGKIKETGDELSETGKKTEDLKRAENNLRDETIRNIETQAELRKVIDEKRLAAEEEGISIQQQIKLLEEADQAEQELLGNRKKLLQEEVRILEQRQQLSKNTAEDNRKLAELKARLTELDGQSASQRVRLGRRLNSLRKQEQSEEQQYYKELEQLRLENLEDEKEKINKETEIKLNAIREKYGLETELEAELIKKRDAKIEELRKANEKKINEQKDKERLEREKFLRAYEEENAMQKLEREEQEALAEIERLKLNEEEKQKVRNFYADKKAKLEQDAIDQRLNEEEILKNQIIASTAQTFGQISNILGEQSKEGKAFAVAQALMNTYQGISAGVALGFPKAIPAIIAASTTGFKAVKDIMSTNVENPSSSGGGGARGASQPQAQAPAFNIVGDSGTNQIADVLGQNANAPSRAYVVSSDVTSSQELDRNIESSASL